LISAGAKFIVIFFNGNSNPLFFIAAVTRSLLSRTALSGRPTIIIEGNCLYIDGVGNYLLIDGANNKLRIDGAE
jgi:hypothetical protein